MLSFKKSLAAAVQAAKDTGLLAAQEGRCHTAAEEALAKAKAERPAPTPPPSALHVNYACKRILMLGVNEDGSEKVLQDIDQSAGTHLTTRSAILLHYSGDAERAKPMLEALARWETENTSLELAKAVREEEEANCAYMAAYSAHASACDAILAVPVRDVVQQHEKVTAFLRASADRLAGRRSWKGRHRGDMTRFLEDQDAADALSAIVKDLATIAATAQASFDPEGWMKERAALREAGLAVRPLEPWQEAVVSEVAIRLVRDSIPAPAPELMAAE